MRFDIEFPTCREGVFVPVNFAQPAQVVETVVAAERLGYDAVWGTDFVTPTPCYAIPDEAPANWYEPLITLAYAAARTTRIKLGTGVLLAIYRDPIILAKQAATLDRLSGGRLLLGLGLGMCRDEFDAVRPRESKAHRGDLLDEIIAALQLLLAPRQEPVSFAGKYVEFSQVNLNPKPLQTPLPIYVPVKVPDAFERVARFGLGMMVQAAVVPQRIEGLKPALDKYGRAPAEIDLVAEGQLRLAKSGEKAAADYRASRQGRHSLKYAGSWETLIANNWIGTAEEVSEKIAAVAARGVTHFNVLHVAGDSLAERLEQMEMFAEEVIPRLA